MSKKTFLVLVLSTLLVAPICAKVTKEYQRPSLHLVLLTTSESSAENTAQITDPEILGYLSDSWINYEFPTLYNNFAIPFSKTDVSSVKGSIMDLLAMYNSPESLNGLTITDLKDIVDQLGGQKYREALKEEVDKLSNEVAHQLVKKWWGISEDGSIDNTLLFELACYSATQNQIPFFSASVGLVRAARLTCTKTAESEMITDMAIARAYTHHLLLIRYTNSSRYLPQA